MECLEVMVSVKHGVEQLSDGGYAVGIDGESETMGRDVVSETGMVGIDGGYAEEE